MEIIEGSRICGKTLGTSFASAVRPNPTTKKCPDGWSPCSKYTSADNTICYRADANTDKTKVCPITEIKYKYFKTKDEAKKWAADDKYDWDVEDYDGDLWMLWTRDADSLPITNSAFET